MTVIVAVPGLLPTVTAGTAAALAGPTALAAEVAGGVAAAAGTGTAAVAGAGGAVSGMAGGAAVYGAGQAVGVTAAAAAGSTTGGIASGLTALGLGAPHGAAAGTVALASQPIGIALLVFGGLVVGAETTKYSITYDCWKPVVRDRTITKSSGRTLNELLQDPRVCSVDKSDGSSIGILTNIWSERFALNLVDLPNGQHALHATKVNE